MEITFYLQYFSYNDENFDVTDNYYQDSNDYIKQLENSYNQTKDVIFEAMSTGNYNTSNAYKIAINKSSEKEEKVSYTSCKGQIFNDAMKEENIDTLLNYFTSGDVLLSYIKFVEESLEEEFESNWRMFLDSSMKISKCNADEDWKFIHKPTRDIYFSLENKKGETVYGKLVNCRIEESINPYENVLIIEKLVFIKNLD